MARGQRRELDGRTILVTGGAHRLGGEISRSLGRRGARVLVHYHRSGEAAAELVAALPSGGAAFQADLSQPQGPGELLAACRQAGESPDGVVHAAASFVRATLAETSAETWDRVFDLNLRSLFLLARAFAVERGGRPGDLVALSDAAAYELWPGYFAHSVAKAAVLPLVRALAAQLAPAIRVNAVVPGPVLPPDDTPAEVREEMARRTLLRRLGSPDDVARAVEFLLTCDYATGGAVEVTGGSQLWRESENER